MPTAIRDQLSEFYRHFAENLDIPDSYREKAEQRYKSVGDWLGRDESTVAQHSPTVYPQGSFRLGTVVKPISDADEYDIDLVCELDLTHGQVTQTQLKEMLGVEIKSYAIAQAMKSRPDEGRRCWTLNYADGAQFHMDALPCIPDTEGFRKRLIIIGVPTEWAQTAISITDRQERTYGLHTTDWPRSNPKGYAEWFASRMKVILLEKKRELVALQKYAEVEEVPEHAVKTPLQRVIQILKRHRDIMFEHDQDDKPISIIITTLAAHAYGGEADLLDALRNVAQGMPEHIMERDGRAWVPNPVNPLENFADKWEEHLQREKKFRSWLQQVTEDLASFDAQTDLRGQKSDLERAFGAGAVGQALRSLSPQDAPLQTSIPSATTHRNSLLAPAGSAVLSLFSVPHRQRPNWEMQLRGNVRVRGFYTRRGFRPQEFSHNCPALAKHWSLRFEASTNIEGRFRVYWQVVNTGEEARRAGSLRGGFCDGLTQQGGLLRNESTLYRGKHWIECFIVKDGVCVARSGEFVVNIE